MLNNKKTILLVEGALRGESLSLDHKLGSGARHYVKWS